MQSGIMISSSNMASPRPNIPQPITIRNEKDDDQVQDEDYDFYYEQKVVTPQFKDKGLKIPQLSLGKQVN